MKIAAISEGNVIDVLFGGDKARAHPVKMYLRNRSHEEKVAALEFYAQVFNIAMAYQSSLSGFTLCNDCCNASHRRTAQTQLEEAFETMQKAGFK